MELNRDSDITDCITDCCLCKKGQQEFLKGQQHGH